MANQFEYFEIRFEATNDIFRGELCEETGEFGPFGMLERNDGQFLIIGDIVNINDEFQFTGHGVVVDQKDLTVYRGQLVDGQKHGFGHLVKFKSIKDLVNTGTKERTGFQDPSSLIKKINKTSYKTLLIKEIEQAKGWAKRCRDKVSKLKSQLMSDSNWTEQIYYTKESID